MKIRDYDEPLEDKLKDIVFEIFNADEDSVEAGYEYGYVQRIKQAFADEYYQLRDEFVPPNQPPVMSGKIWYDRFEKEFLVRIADEDEMPDYGKAIEAAKKASGL